MKILFLNPHLYGSPLLGTLRGLGVATLVCADLRECELVFKLHATSVSLFVGHDEDGFGMNEVIKKNPRFARTPVVLTTSKWTDQQCIEHQGGPFGANAYFRMPVDDREFIHVVDQILGTGLSHGRGFNVSDGLDVIASESPSGGIPLAEEKTTIAPMVLELASSGGGIQIEDASSVYGQSAPEPSGSDPLFTLEAPNGGESGESAGLTKEFRIEGTGAGAAPVASEILALPIEATSLETIDDDQPTRAAAPIASAPEEIDAESLAAMPYLGRGGGYANPLAYREPMDDSVVPGGAATAPDAETLKKYLYLREQDVTALSAQLRQARDQIALLESQLKQERAISSEFAHLAQEQDRRIDGFEKEKSVAVETVQKEYDELKFEMKRRNEKVRVMELHVKEATEATERLKERVRGDIRKIRSREKELENRLEIMKKDSEALLAAREQKIIELKRKLDLMEFNADLVQELLEKERQTANALREKLTKAAQMVRVAGGLLGPEAEALLGPEGAAGGVPGTRDDDRTTAA